MSDSATAGSPAAAQVVRAGQGEGIWFLNTLLTVKAGAGAAQGAFTWLEQLCPPGFAPPPHVHEAETEAFYLLDGRMTVTCAGVTAELVPGDFVLLPRGVPHGFAVDRAGPARFIHLTAPGQFDHFAREVGEPAGGLRLPEPREPDLAELREVAARYRLGILAA